MRSPENKIADIQILRGASILFVLGQHFSLTTQLIEPFAKQISLPFYIGVELFFIISGYVVTKSLINDHFNPFRFVVKRIFRLLPATLIFLAFSYTTIVLLRGDKIPEPLSRMCGADDAAFFQQGLGVVGGYYIITAQKSTPLFSNQAMWSLSVEDQFYAALAIISLIAVVSRRLTRIPAKWWAGAASAFMLIVAFRYRLQVLEGRQVFSDIQPRIIYFLLRFNYDFLPLGVLLALFDSSCSGWIARRFKETGPAFAGYLLVVPLACVAICHHPVDLQHRDRFLVGLGLPMAAVCFSALVLLAGNQCAFPTTHGWVCRWLKFLGNRSFSYYLFNFPAIAFGFLLLSRCPSWTYRNRQVANLSEFVMTVIVIVPIVELVYRYVELPLTRLGKRLVDGQRIKVDSAPPATTNDSTILPIPLASTADKVAA